MSERSEQIGELAAALAKAQGEMENAPKISDNPFFKSKYADLAGILNMVRPALSKNGIAVAQHPSFDGGTVSVQTILLHSSGQWMSSTIAAPVAKSDAQGIGSATTYCRRYALAAIAGIAQEDDDGNSAVGGAARKDASGVKPDDAIVAVFDKAKTTEELAEAWKSVPVGIRANYAATKDAAKARVQAAKNAAKAAE